MLEPLPLLPFPAEDVGVEVGFDTVVAMLLLVKAVLMLIDNDEEVTVSVLEEVAPIDDEVDVIDISVVEELTPVLSPQREAIIDRS